MGNVQDVEIGAKSTHKAETPLAEEEVDFKDPRNSARAKKELYALFLEDKLIHSAKAQELKDENEALKEEIATLKRRLEEYTRWNLPGSSMPPETPKTPSGLVAERFSGFASSTMLDSFGARVRTTPKAPEIEDEDLGDPGGDSSPPENVPENPFEASRGAIFEKKPLRRIMSAPKSLGTKERKDLQARISRIAEKIKAAQKRLRSSSR
jgi:hypothetical protein